MQLYLSWLQMYNVLKTMSREKPRSVSMVHLFDTFKHLTGIKTTKKKMPAQKGPYHIQQNQGFLSQNPAYVLVAFPSCTCICCYFYILTTKET